jgi:2-oxoglutarate dehydrogenase complex dehydrogenase (E1) component-like enzyme
MESRGAREHGWVAVCGASLQETAGNPGEPRSSLPWTHTHTHPTVSLILSLQLRFVGRRAYPCPATGVPKIHQQEAKQLLTDTFAKSS